VSDGDNHNYVVREQVIQIKRKSFHSASTAPGKGRWEAARSVLDSLNGVFDRIEKSKRSRAAPFSIPAE
jgi:hypothetical protein